MIDRIGNLASVGYTLPRTSAISTPKALSTAFNGTDSRSAKAQRGIVRLTRALESLSEMLNGGGRNTSVGPPSAASAAALSLSSTSTAARLRSTEEVNTTPTSFSPFGPSFAGASTSLPTIGGTYSGTVDKTYTFTVKTTAGLPAGIVGVDRMFLDMTDGQGNKLDSIKIDNTTPVGTVFSLSNGLRLSVSAGTMANGDSFVVQAYASIDGQLDPTKPFNGTRNSNPNLQAGYSVTNGSFTVNGETITVSASDSLNAVLQRINASGAGVTASYDSATEQVSLVQNTLGSNYTVALGADTSGFLAAMKLDRNILTPGTGDELHDPMATIPELAGISAGSFSVNGVAISVDPAVDSLAALLERIEQSGAGVTATYNESLGVVAITNVDPTQTLDLWSGTTGLFPTLGIADGTRQPIEPEVGSGYSASRSERVADLMDTIAKELSGLFRSSEDGTPSRVGKLQATLRAAVSEAFGRETDRYKTGFGLTFDFAGSKRDVFSFGDQDREKLIAQLRRDPSDVRTLLFGDGDDSQALGSLFIDALDTARRDIGKELGQTGVFVNAVA